MKMTKWRGSEIENDDILVYFDFSYILSFDTQNKNYLNN